MQYQGITLTQICYVFVMVALSYWKLLLLWMEPNEKWHRYLRALKFFFEFSEEFSTENEWELIKL